MTTEPSPGALAAGDQNVATFQEITEEVVAGVRAALTGDETRDVSNVLMVLDELVEARVPGATKAVAACAIVRLARQDGAGIRADERRKVVAEIVAEFEEQLKWQRDTGCHKMSGTPEIGRFIGWEDALAEVRKHAEVKS